MISGTYLHAILQVLAGCMATERPTEKSQLPFGLLCGVFSKGMQCAPSKR